jgi:hypothetical protein
MQPAAQSARSSVERFTAGGALAGTANMLGAPGCADGYYYYNGYCYQR